MSVAETVSLDVTVVVQAESDEHLSISSTRPFVFMNEIRFHFSGLSQALEAGADTISALSFGDAAKHHFFKVGILN